jgi:hypothetical protein
MMAASLDHGLLLGMLTESKLSESGGRRFLDLSTDNLPCTVRFEIDKRHNSFYFATVQTRNCS